MLTHINRGMSGLLHISQISYDRIEDLSALLQVGMVVKCMIIDHDVSVGRIALSTKTLEPEPGDMLKNPQKVTRRNCNYLKKLLL
jgi:small subunit ribosomal protein S1